MENRGMRKEGFSSFVSVKVIKEVKNEEGGYSCR